MVSFLLSASGNLFALADGLYWVSDAATDLSVKTTSGKEIYLDQPFTDKIDGAELLSITNDNSKFQCLIHQPQADPTNRAIALVSQGTCVFIQGRGTANVGWFRNDVVSAPVETDMLAAFFHIQPQKRTRPDYKLNMKLLLKESGYIASEPITAEFRITNDGTEPIVLEQPLTIVTRDGNLMFQATRQGDSGADEKVDVIESKVGSGVQLMVSDPKQNISGGLAPGESFSVTIDLKEYLRLDKPGTYTIHTTCALELVPAGVNDTDQWGFVRDDLQWDESPSIDTKLQINGY